MKFWPHWLRSPPIKKPVTSDRSLLIAKTARELLLPHQNLLRRIRSQACVPEAHWKVLYLSFIERLAELVQQMPASESHHHAQAGGLLLHSLEVGHYALQFRSGKMLPLGASPEVISEKQEIWSYAILTAAMMHDLGKPLVDQEITFHTENHKNIRWKPFSGAMKIGTEYEVKFRSGRKYLLHEALPSLLASRLIPAEGLNWLSSDMEILEAWILCLSGRKNEAGILGEIISQADQLSVAESLTGSEAYSLPAVKKVPLHQRLITGLKYLLENDQLPLNRKGAAGWEYEGKLWLVSKRVLDELRKHMLEEGQSGIPSDNTRLMDELLQHGVLVPNEDARAIWKVTVSIDSWSQEFTCLCIPLTKLWTDSENWPVSSNLTVLSDVGNAIPKKDNETVPKEEKKNDCVKSFLPKNEEKPFNSEKPNLAQSSLLEGLPLPPGVEIYANNEIDKGQKSHLFQKEGNQTGTSHSKLANKFIDWLSSGIANGSLTVNHVGAAIHTVEEGLLLVSPAIFRNYAKTHGEVDYTQVQRAFQSLGVNKITQEDTNVWTYVVQGRRKKASCLKGMVISEPVKVLGIRLPPPNPVLSLENLS